MIAIKSMKNIPKSCIECELLKHGGFCYYKNPPYELNSRDILDERPSDCPLIKIITCKDCKYYRNGLEHCTQWVMPTNDDFYCADAERSMRK